MRIPLYLVLAAVFTLLESLKRREVEALEPTALFVGSARATLDLDPSAGRNNADLDHAKLRAHRA